MIIGNNGFNNNFESSKIVNPKKDDLPNNDSEDNNSNIKNIFTNDLDTFKYSNAESSDDMYNKALALLNERLENKTITLEEFNKKCEELRKKRNNS